MERHDKHCSDLCILSAADNPTMDAILADARSGLVKAIADCAKRALSGEIPVHSLDLDMDTLGRRHGTNWRRIAEKEPVASKRTLLLQGGRTRKSLNRLLQAYRHQQEGTSSRRTLAKRGGSRPGKTAQALQGLVHLTKANPAVRRHWVHSMPKPSMGLAEQGVRAILKGDVALTEAQKDRLRPYKKDLRTLASSNADDVVKRRVLQSKAFLDALFTPAKSQ